MISNLRLLLLGGETAVMPLVLLTYLLFSVPAFADDGNVGRSAADRGTVFAGSAGGIPPMSRGDVAGESALSTMGATEASQSGANAQSRTLGTSSTSVSSPDDVRASVRTADSAAGGQPSPTPPPPPELLLSQNGLKLLVFGAGAVIVATLIFVLSRYGQPPESQQNSGNSIDPHSTSRPSGGRKGESAER